MKYTISALIIIILISCTPLKVDSFYCDNMNSNISSYENQVFILLNEYRLSKGLDNVYSDVLCASNLAKEHCVYMDSVNNLSHYNYQYRASELYSRGAESVGEIGGRNYGFPIALVNAFKQSQRHNRVILGDYNHIGIGSYNGFITIMFYKYEVNIKKIK